MQSPSAPRSLPVASPSKHEHHDQTARNRMVDTSQCPGPAEIHVTVRVDTSSHEQDGVLNVSGFLILKPMTSKFPRQTIAYCMISKSTLQFHLGRPADLHSCDLLTSGPSQRDGRNACRSSPSFAFSSGAFFRTCR